MEREEVDPNRSEHAYVKRNPEPDTRRHRREVFTRRGLRQPQISTCVRRVRCVACDT